MPKIPSIQSRVALGRASPGGYGASRSSASDFGAQTGEAVGALGRGAEQLAAGIRKFEETQINLKASKALANADFTARELAIRNEVGPGAEGYQERVLEDYDAWVDEQAEALDDDATRTKLREALTGRRNQVSSRAAQYEFTTRAANAKNMADETLTALDNRIRVSPEDFDDLSAQAVEMLDVLPGIDSTTRAAMKTRWRENAALARFEGMIENAVTPADLENISAQVEEEKWTEALSTQGLERVKSLTQSRLKTEKTRRSAEARTVVKQLEDRAQDVSVLIPKEELDAAQTAVAASGDPSAIARMSRIVRDRRILEETRGLNVAQQRSLIDNSPVPTGLPKRLDAAVAKASAMFGVSAAYLAGTARREYGMFLKGNEADIDYGKGNADGASSALGPMQFIESTWLDEVIAKPEFLAATGLDVSGMTDAEKLALRGDPEIAMLGGAFWTAQNDKLAAQALGRKPSDAERYIMHFMGRSGGPRLFRYVSEDPTAPASVAFPEAAEANPTIFTNKDGSSKTVLEAYENLSAQHTTREGTDTYVAYGDRELREKLLADTEAKLKSDPMSLAERTGLVALGSVFEEGGMEARGDAASVVADFYNVPKEDMKPFTRIEQEAIAKQLTEADADQALGLIMSVQTMGDDMSEAALAQLGEKGSVYALAGGLALQAGRSADAAITVRGQKRIEENGDIVKQLGAPFLEINAAFVDTTQGALAGVDPAQRQALTDAALAHYVETAARAGKLGSFDTEMYEESINAVLGSGLDEVNGVQTVLPAGVGAEELETAFNDFTLADWTRVSVSGSPPRYSTGAEVDPRDIEDEVTLRAIGGGQYEVLLGDGSSLVTGDVSRNGGFVPFLVEITPEALTPTRERVAAEGEARSTQNEDIADAMREAAKDGSLTLEEVKAIRKKYGVSE